MEIFEKQSEIEYTFEFTQEVFEKMKNAENLHLLITQENVQDLECIDISGKFYCKIKRLLDILVSLMGMIVLLLPMGVIALAIYIDDPGAVIFSQYRVGLHGKRFKLYKFRTMKYQTPKYLATSEIEHPDQYITKLGCQLRKTSLDEIPQLINVLKGDMSLIGPRPLISDEYEMHIMRSQFGIYNIRPGITGLAQINGRDQMGVNEKIHWDMKYVREFGFRTDWNILMTTIPRVLKKDGVIEGGTEYQSDSYLNNLSENSRRKA